MVSSCCLALDFADVEVESAAKRLENVLEPCAEGVEHGPLTHSTANPYRSDSACSCQRGREPALLGFDLEAEGPEAADGVLEGDRGRFCSAE